MRIQAKQQVTRGRKFCDRTYERIFEMIEMSCIANGLIVNRMKLFLPEMIKYSR